MYMYIMLSLIYPLMLLLLVLILIEGSGGGGRGGGVVDEPNFIELMASLAPAQAEVDAGAVAKAGQYFKNTL
jgi:hypothetical protein